MPRRGPEAGVHRILAIPNPFRVGGNFYLNCSTRPYKYRQIMNTLSCKLAHFCDIPGIIPSLINRRFTNKRE